MNKTTYFRNGRWHQTIELDRSVPEDDPDGSLIDLARWIIGEVRAQLIKYVCRYNRNR